MRTARVFYLFLSVLQFIFFLKLVEYVRGEEIDSPNSGDHAADIPNSPISRQDEESRGMFIAPNIKRKKLRAWGNGKSSNLAKNDSSEITELGSENNSSQPISQSKREQYEKEVARLCPACENNQCASVSPIGAGFPVVPVIIAVITGIAWFILFLIVWIFYQKPHKEPESGGYGGGYDGGYASPQPEYGVHSEKSSIFDQFLKPTDRSLHSYITMVHNVLDSIGKLNDLYSNS